jgi:hypothetical protein
MLSLFLFRLWVVQQKGLPLSGYDQVMINFLPKTTKPQLNWGLFLNGAEGGINKGDCCGVTLRSLSAFLSAFSASQCAVLSAEDRFMVTSL